MRRPERRSGTATSSPSSSSARSSSGWGSSASTSAGSTSRCASGRATSSRRPGEARRVSAARRRLRLPRRGLPLPFRAARARACACALVVTHRDSPGENIWFASVRAPRAARRGSEVATPDGPQRAGLRRAARGIAPDFLFSFYYRQMLSPAVLAIARRGAFNMHGSLLPKYRGRVPVNWAIIHGERETGATLHEMVAKPDAGRIVDQEAVPIGDNDTAARSVRPRDRGRRAGARRARCPRSSTARRRFAPQDLARRELFRRPQARGRAHRLDERRPGRSTTSCAPWRRPTPAPSPHSRAARARAAHLVVANRPRCRARPRARVAVAGRPRVGLLRRRPLARAARGRDRRRAVLAGAALAARFAPGAGGMGQFAFG